MLNKNNPYPLKIENNNFKSIIFLNHFITKSHIKVGDYTYYHSKKNAEEFENTNVLYDVSNNQIQLEIGKFCQIATDTKFMCAYAEHHINSFTTYPLFWKDGFSPPDKKYFHNKGVTTIGHDVWFGYDSLIMPGVTIGNGAIIASRSVVTQNIPAYAVVGGNPAKIIRMRFKTTVIKELLELNWWNWPIEIIENSYEEFLNCDIKKLKKITF